MNNQNHIPLKIRAQRIRVCYRNGDKPGILVSSDSIHNTAKVMLIDWVAPGFASLITVHDVYKNMIMLGWGTVEENL